MNKKLADVLKIHLPQESTQGSETPREAEKPLSFRSPDEILGMPRDEHNCIWGDRVLAKGQQLVAAGIGGLGKSRILGQGLVATIIGREWCGLETHGRGMRCMIVQTENGTARLQRDIEAWKKWVGNEKDWELVNNCLRIHTFETDNDLMLHLSDQRNESKLQSAIQEFNPDIVLFDPLRDISIGDLNSDDDMRATCHALSRIAHVGNPDRAIIIITHAITGKTGAGRAFGVERSGFARNSKVLFMWARAQINIVAGNEDNNELLLISCAKNNNGREFPPVAVRLNPETMIYSVDDDFDIGSWREEISSTTKRRIFRPEIVIEIDWPKKRLTKPQLVKALANEEGIGRSRCYELVDEAQVAGLVQFNKKTRTYAKTR
jgi:hypothetical protein